MSLNGTSFNKWHYRENAQECSTKLTRKLSFIDDRGQTDRVAALPRPYALDIDLDLSP